MPNTFINPYTFIPLPKSKKKIYEREVEKLTGWIECEMALKTDVFIPNTSYEEALIDNRRLKLKENRKHESYEFYSYEQIDYSDEERVAPDKPVIPGSEIRGAIRSVYEVLTDSCLSVLEDKDLSARYIDPKNPGILRCLGNDEWEILPAKRYMLQAKYHEPQRGNDSQVNYEDRLRRYNNNKIHNTKYIYHKGKKCFFIDVGSGKKHKLEHGSLVNFSLRDKQFESRNGKMLDLVEDIVPYDIKNTVYQKGYIVIGENIYGKHHESVFVLMTDEEIKEEKLSILSPKKGDIDNFKRIIEKYYGDKKLNTAYKNNNHSAYKFIDLNNLKKKGAIIPVWYSKVGERLYMSPAAIGRELYHNKVYDLVRDYLPCGCEREGAENVDGRGNDNKKLDSCASCSLFGTLTKNNLVKSRLRFTDAELLEGDKADYRTPKTLKILGGPKISSFEFYTRPKNNVAIWNADYYIDRDGGEHLFNEGDLSISGRKFYWHNSVKKIVDSYSVSRDSEKKNLNVTVRPLKKSDKKSNKFKFKVYFDEIDETELKRLVFSLNFGDNENNVCHKIGKGKPLGLGSVKIMVHKVFTRSFDIDKDGHSISIRKREYQDLDILVNSISSKPEYIDCSDETFIKLMTVANFNTINSTDAKKITYPYKENAKGEKEIFKWFAKNRPSIGGEKKFKQKLPELSADVKEQELNV